MKTTILLTDNHKIVRDGLRSLIEKQPEMEVIGEEEQDDQEEETPRQSKSSFA